MSIPTQCVASVMVLVAATCVWANPAQKDGTLEDLRKISDEENIATEALDLPVSVDASGLAETNYYSEHSREIQLEPDTRYTLGITYRAEGSSLISAGIKWQMPGEPAGLVDTELRRARWPQADEWTLRVLTFRSDHEYTTARIILKAFGGMSLEVRDVVLVEGWYCD